MKRVLLYISLILSLISCKKDVDDTPAPVDIRVKDFIWKGLNYWYLWQSDVPNLADNRFASSVALTNSTSRSYVEFLTGYSDSETLFYSLLNQYGTIDRFSYITDNYTELEESFQGVSLSSGMNFGLSRYGGDNSTAVLGFVRYVLPGSSAETQGVKRGDVFLSVNGTPLTLENYSSLLFNEETSMTIDINKIQKVNNQPTIISTGTSITMTKSKITENPIFIKKVLSIDNHKIGYLMYNSFIANFDTELNEAFAYFKSEGVTSLVVDLRYNGGGSIQSAVYLSSMITGQFTGEIFAKERWNSKLQPVIESSSDKGENRFVNTITKSGTSASINSLQLSKVYILTSRRTASASELVINGLKAYIEVVQIGETTVGKNQGSITVYDSPTGFTKNNINPGHKWAMQPLVLKIENAKGEGDYTSGLTPNQKVTDDLINFGTLGDETEPLLAKTIELITGNSSTDKVLSTKSTFPANFFIDSKSFDIGSNGMYK